MGGVIGISEIIDIPTILIPACPSSSLMAENEEELKTFVKKVKEWSEKAGLKLNIQKTKIITSSPITSRQILSKLAVETIFIYSSQIIYCVLSHFSRGPRFAILWTVAHQSPLSMAFSRQGY